VPPPITTASPSARAAVTSWSDSGRVYLIADRRTAG
jgi:hypothetical protein